MQNRIAELRKARGWSLREMASKLNTSAGTVHGLEKGSTRLNTDWIRKLSKLFDISPAELLGEALEKPTGFSEDATPWTDEGPSLILGDAQFLYEVNSAVLDQLGLFPGGILVVDMSPVEMSKIATGNVVIAQAYRDKQATTILRQFVEPSLLITNSSGENFPIINLRNQDVVIKGLVVASHQILRHKHSAKT